MNTSSHRDTHISIQSANQHIDSSQRALRLREMAAGFIVGVLAWAVAKQFGMEVLPVIGGWADSPLSFWMVGIAGALLATTRARSLLWIASGLVCVICLTVISSPGMMSAARSLVREDSLQKVDAIYVLGAGINEDGTPDDHFQQRVLQAYELLGQGYAPRLIVPHLHVPRFKKPALPYLPFVRRQMSNLHLRYHVEELGKVSNTFEEAVAVAKLVRQRGWKRIIVVSSPTHMRRVAAVFTKAGAPILCSPCPEGNFDLSGAGSVVDRQGAFRTWLHEVVGYRVYQLRGRI